MAQLPRLTSPYMLIAACRFQNTPTWGGRGEARERTLLWSVDVRGGHPQRHPDASDAAGRGRAKPLFITTNLDVLEKNLQGAAVQKAAGEKKRTSASNQPPALPGGAREGLRGRACCRPLQGPPGG